MLKKPMFSGFCNVLNPHHEEVHLTGSQNVGGTIGALIPPCLVTAIVREDRRKSWVGFDKRAQVIQRLVVCVALLHETRQVSPYWRSENFTYALQLRSLAVRLPKVRPPAHGSPP